MISTLVATVRLWATVVPISDAVTDLMVCGAIFMLTVDCGIDFETINRNRSYLDMSYKMGDAQLSLRINGRRRRLVSWRSCVSACSATGAATGFDTGIVNCSVSGILIQHDGGQRLPTL
jgi:hypothetical protein